MFACIPHSSVFDLMFSLGSKAPPTRGTYCIAGYNLVFFRAVAEKLCPMPHTCAAFSSPTNRIAFDIHRPTVNHRWLLSVDRHDDRPRLTVTRPRDDYLFYFCPADPAGCCSNYTTTRPSRTTTTSPTPSQKAPARRPRCSCWISSFWLSSSSRT